MRKFLVSIAAAGTALAFASPAAAQYYPAPQQYGYGYNNGYNSGYNNWGQVRSLQARIHNVERQINILDRRNYVRDNRADRLRAEANEIERRLNRSARYGLNPYEANDINARIARLEQRVQYAVGNRGYGRYGGYSNYGNYGDYGYDGRRHDRDDDRDGRGYDRDDD